MKRRRWHVADNTLEHAHYRRVVLLVSALGSLKTITTGLALLLSAVLVHPGGRLAALRISLPGG